MQKQKLIQQGAEAKILLSGNKIIKDRISKSYRLKELDDKIRKQRTKSETKLLTKASEIIPVPLPLDSSDNFKIHMPFIKGKRLSEHLDYFPLSKQKNICEQIGQSISKLHDADIIHGDLTTSNMILVENADNLPAHSCSQNIDRLTNKNKQTSDTLSLIKNQSASKSERIFFIDFGLGFISHKLEDKAVDLHLLKQALEARHFSHWETLFNAVIKGYKTIKLAEAKKISERLKAVEKRGRYKH
jgi:TP53 regulating kinase and related kinases